MRSAVPEKLQGMAALCALGSKPSSLYFAQSQHQGSGYLANQDNIAKEQLGARKQCNSWHQHHTILISSVIKHLVGKYSEEVHQSIFKSHLP